MLKIRIQRKGVKKKPVFIIVVANSKSPRDGKFIEKLGYYNPIYKINLKLKLNKINYWLTKGAKMTKKVKLLKKIYCKNTI